MESKRRLERVKRGDVARRARRRFDFVEDARLIRDLGGVISAPQVNGRPTSGVEPLLLKRRS